MNTSVADITDSQLYMWRSVFALAHADNIVCEYEVRYMAEILEDVQFTNEQRKILNNDITEAQDIIEMYKKISNPYDQAKFFKFAHKMVWVDGEYGEEEQKVMLKLQETHITQTNVDEIVGYIDLEFDEDYDPYSPERQEKLKAKDLLYSFRDQFF